jgi:hypothetical protein
VNREVGAGLIGRGFCHLGFGTSVDAVIYCLKRRWNIGIAIAVKYKVKEGGV